MTFLLLQGVDSLNGALIGEAVVDDDETMMDLDLLGREDQEFLFSSLQDTWREAVTVNDHEEPDVKTEIKKEEEEVQPQSEEHQTVIKEEVPDEHIEGRITLCLETIANAAVI